MTDSTADWPDSSHTRPQRAAATDLAVPGTYAHPYAPSVREIGEAVAKGSVRRRASSLSWRKRDGCDVTQGPALRYEARWATSGRPGLYWTKYSSPQVRLSPQATRKLQVNDATGSRPELVGNGTYTWCKSAGTHD
jgi:hypothetical protein